MDFVAFFGWNATFFFGGVSLISPRPLALDGGEAMMIQEGLHIQRGKFASNLCEPL